MADSGNGSRIASWPPPTWIQILVLAGSIVAAYVRVEQRLTDLHEQVQRIEQRVDMLLRRP